MTSNDNFKIKFNSQIQESQAKESKKDENKPGDIEISFNSDGNNSILGYDTYWSNKEIKFEPVTKKELDKKIAIAKKILQLPNASEEELTKVRISLNLLPAGIMTSPDPELRGYARQDYYSFIENITFTLDDKIAGIRTEKFLATPEGQKAADIAIEKIYKTLNSVEMPDYNKYGNVKRTLDQTVVHWFGTSVEEVWDEYHKSFDNAKTLRISKTKDPIAFARAYKSLTGTNFEPKKILAADELKEKCQQNYSGMVASEQILNKLKAGQETLKKGNSVENLNELKQQAVEICSLLSGQSAEEVEKELAKQFEKINNKSFSKVSEAEKADAYSKILNFYTADEKINSVKETYENFKKSYEKNNEEHKTLFKEAYGENKLSKAVQDNQEDIEIAYTVTKVAVVIGATIATGGIAGAVGAGAMATIAATSTAAAFATAAIETTEKSTDNDGLSWQETKNIGKEALIAGMFTALGGGANALGSIAKGASTKYVASTIAQRAIGETVEFGTDVATSFLATKAIGGETTWGSEAMQSGLPQLGFMVAGGFANRFARGAMNATDSVDASAFKNISNVADGVDVSAPKNIDIEVDPKQAAEDLAAILGKPDIEVKDVPVAKEVQPAKDVPIAKATTDIPTSQKAKKPIPSSDLQTKLINCEPMTKFDLDILNKFANDNGLTLKIDKNIGDSKVALFTDSNGNVVRRVAENRDKLGTIYGDYLILYNGKQEIGGKIFFTGEAPVYYKKTKGEFIELESIEDLKSLCKPETKLKEIEPAKDTPTSATPKPDEMPEVKKPQTIAQNKPIEQPKSISLEEKIKVFSEKFKLSEEDLKNPILRHNIEHLYEFLISKKSIIDIKYLKTRKFTFTLDELSYLDELNIGSKVLKMRAQLKNYPIEIMGYAKKASDTLTKVEVPDVKLNLGSDVAYGKDLIGWYQSKIDNSAEVNNALRNSQPLSGKASEVVKFFDSHQRALGENTVLIRGTNFAGDLKPGSIITDNGYMSCATKEGFFGNMDEGGHPFSKFENYLIIKTPANQKVLVPFDWTKKDDMGEIILPRGTSLKVLEVGSLTDYGNATGADIIPNRKVMICEIVDNNPSIQPAKNMPVAKAGDNIPKETPMLVSTNEKLLLGKDDFPYPLDLSSPEIKSKIDALKDGESLTVGRSKDADIQVPSIFNSTSRKHLTLTKQGDKLVVIDNSSFGTKVYSEQAKAKVVTATKTSGYRIPQLDTLRINPGAKVTYNADGKIICVEQSVSKGLSKVDIKYDNGLISKVDWQHSNGTKTVAEYHPNTENVAKINTYNKDGKLERLTGFNANGTEKTLDLEFSSLGEKIYIENKLADGPEIYSFSKNAKTTFDAEGKPSSIQYTDAKKQTFTDELVYSKDGNLESIITKNSDGKIVEKQKIYTQNDTIEVPELGEVKVSAGSKVYLDANDKITFVKIGDNQKIQIKYDEAGNISKILSRKDNMLGLHEAKVFVRDANGKLVDKVDEYAKFVESRPDLYDDLQQGPMWAESVSANGAHTAWKMHLFSVDTQDYQLLADKVIPYLKENDIKYKTFSKRVCPEFLGSQQAGKAFTIYPHSNDEMAKVARDLDRIIRENNLTKADSKIIGDRQMGDSGRLFYRYELKSGQDVNKVFDLNNPDGKHDYHANYAKNRGGDNYLASDMKPEDDIWLKFNPSENPAKVADVAKAEAKPATLSPELAKIKAKQDEILAKLKDKLTPEQYAKAKEIAFIEARGDKQFSGSDIIELSHLSDAEFAKAKERGLFYIEARGDKQFSCLSISILSKLSDAEFAKAKELFYIEGRGDMQFLGGDIAELSKLSDAEFAKAKELLYIEGRGDNQFSHWNIAAFAKLSDTEFAKAKELFYIEARGDNQFNGAEIIDLAKLSDAEFNKRSKHLGNPNLNFYDFEQMAKYSPQNIENYVLLKDKGFTGDIADKIIQSIPVKTSKPVKTSAKPQSKYNIIEAELKKSNLEFTDKMGIDADNLSKVIKIPLFSQHLALINNLSVEQVMDIYGDKLKRQMSGFVAKLSIEQKSALKNDGIDTDSLLQKLNAKSDAPVIKQPKVKQARTKQSLPEIEKQIIDKFNVPQEIYQDINKFNDFCKSKFEELINTEYTSKGFPESAEITKKRTDILNNWKKLFDEEDMDYRSRLLITSTITKDLEVGNKSTPLQPSIQVANEIINAIDQGKNVSKALAKNATDSMVFSKINRDGIEGEWVRIPSKINDPENFADNVNKLKALSLHNWCTHTFNAEPYLSMGDFYVFRSNGKTELGVRFEGKKIQEIQGFMNNRTIPLPFANIAKEFVESNNFKATGKTISDIAESVNTKPEFDLLQAEIEQLLKDKNYEDAFEKLGIKVLGERNGKLIIQTNKLSSNLYRMQDFKGSDELWSQVCEVKYLSLEEVNTIRNLDVINGKTIPWDMLK